MMNEIVISAQNNTNVNQIVNLFQAVNLSANPNAVTQYAYDLSGYDITNMVEVYVEARLKGTDPYTTYYSAVAEPTLDSLAAALTGLGLGTWYAEGTTLYTSNDQLEFFRVDPNIIYPA